MAKIKKSTDQSSQSRMADGTMTKAIYVKNLAVSDWQLLEQLMAQNNFKTVADVLAFCVRKAAGVI